MWIVRAAAQGKTPVPSAESALLFAHVERLHASVICRVSAAAGFTYRAAGDMEASELSVLLCGFIVMLEGVADIKAETTNDDTSHETKLERQEIPVHFYQPIWDVDDRKAGSGALLPWRRKTFILWQRESLFRKLII